ncbi:MAG: hypothetical protein IJM18_02420, partial [Clostridia bacterium]|nr:hypothetical protein [Clostridia bacterium]
IPQGAPRPAAPVMNNNQQFAPRPAAPVMNNIQQGAPRPAAPVMNNNQQGAPRPAAPVMSNIQQGAPRPAAPAERAAGSETAPESAPEKKRPSSKRKLKTVIACVLIAAVLFSVGWFVIRPKLKGSEGLTAQQKTELLRLVDRAETVFVSSEESRKALAETDYIGMAGVYETACGDIEGLRGECSKLGIEDEKLAGAADKYFGMLYDSCSGRLAVCRFMDDCSKSFLGMLDSRPDINSYTSGVLYISDMQGWLSSIRSSYEEITCPDCISSEWVEFGDLIDTNELIIDKITYYAKYSDPLSIHAAYQLNDRYVKYQAAQRDKIYSRYESSLSLSQAQYLKAVDLKNEIHDYTGLKPKAMREYEFKNAAENEPVFVYESAAVIYPAFYGSYDAFLIVKAGCLSGSRDIVVEAEIPGLTQKYKESFSIGTEGKTIYVKSPMLTDSVDLSSAKDSQIQVSIYDKNGTDLIESKTIPVTIKSKNDFEWFTDDFGTATKYNILSFLMPESDAITELKRAAIDEIYALSSGRLQAFVGYQDTGYTRESVTRIQALGLMRALFKSGVRYNNDTFSISGSHQHILFPDEVLKNKTGLCIETSLVIASALQSAGMHAYLVFPPGHAQVAVEVFDHGEGQGQYLLIETTRLTADSVDGSVTLLSYGEWLSYLSNCDVIDCNDASALGINPFVH